MKVIIIDNNGIDTDVLRTKLEKYSNIQVIGTAKNGTDGLDLLITNSPDVIFLDIELPDMSGMEFLDIMHERTDKECNVIIYTAYTKYMLSSFRKKAFDFLLKPIDNRDLDTIIKLLYIENIKHPTSDLKVSNIKKMNEKKLLFYTNTVDFRFVKISNIGLFKHNHDTRVWEVILADSEEPLRLKRSTTNTMLLGLDSNFVQVNQKYIVNMNYIVEVNDNICKFYPPFDKIDYVNVGSFFRKKLINRFNSL